VSTGGWTPDTGEGTSLTRSLTVSASARALTDPAAARCLAALFADLDPAQWRCSHASVEVGFLADLALALHAYAAELERAHDEVVRAVASRWPDWPGGEAPGP
jgi:hypothetical protein